MIQYEPMRIVPIESNCTNPLQCESNANRIAIQSNPIQSNANAISIRFSYLVLAHARWNTLTLIWVSCCSLLIHCILSFIRTCHIVLKKQCGIVILVLAHAHARTREWTMWAQGLVSWPKHVVTKKPLVI